MQFIIELDGPVVDVRRRYDQAHRRTQSELGLAARTPEEFWRLVRKGAPMVQIVRPYRTAQIDHYARRFTEYLLSPELCELDTPQPDAVSALRGLADIAPCSLVVLRDRREAARKLLDRHELWRFFRIMRMLSGDRATRIAQLTERIREGGQAVVAAGSDVLARAASEVGAVVIGVANGTCTPQRLRQAGANVVVGNLTELLERVRAPDEELIRAGFRPA